MRGGAIVREVGKLFLAALLVVFGLVGPAAGAGPITWGVDGPDGRRADLKAIFEVMQARGLTQYRVSANLARDTDPYAVQMYRDMLALAKTYGITLKPILATPFAWGDRTDGGKYPAGDWNALYQQAYSRTYTFVINFKDQINDWELGNEINLLALDPSGKKLYGRGWTAEEFDMPVMNDWVAILKGMSDAIGKINREYGLHLRRTLNTTSTMFGFLDFMASKGVEFDVISYHYYEVLNQNPNRAWGGSRQAYSLFKKLGTYGKPVVFNEINCGEIYKPAYENEAGKPLTEACYKSLHATLSYIVRQSDVDIESVLIYELLDEPAKAPPENRFGLMYDIRTPKVPLYMLSRFAGKELAPHEAEELAKRGM